MSTKKTATGKNDDPRWKGYERAGSKIKNGKKAPDCVPEKKKLTVRSFLF